MRDLEKFDAIQISIASPEEIYSWSFGEVKKPETINYRTHKPERDGLFCEKIFGPTRDWECFCGRFRSIRYKGVVCERCGVEVTRSKVRRERMGHIDLAAPVAHIWFVKGTFSYIALLLDISPRDLEKIIYFNSYVVIDPGNLPLMEKQLLSEVDFRRYRKKYGDLFDARMGAEAVKILLQKLDIPKLVADLKSKLGEKSGAKKQNIIKRLQVSEMFLNSLSQPEWMIIDVVPVIPPDLRPMVQLDGGRFATSDLNDLYRRVINRNNRLKRLLDLQAPEIIIKNEKRMLQEAVNSLIDNGRRGRPVTGTGKRPLKSLNDMLTGKQGRFRENLLGKRVDYSGRSVIVVGPELKIHNCGLPKKMALELFKPFIMNKLVNRGISHNIKSAKKLLERANKPEVMDVLEEVIRDHPILLNRAPTLHRLGIQAFEPVLSDGKAIQLHPLVCAAFNADFDGDQMAVHIPLLVEAQIEAKMLMMSSNNLFSPANGKPIAVPSQDMAIGCYYLTRAFPTTRVKTVAQIYNGRKILSTLEDQLIGKCIDFYLGEKIVHPETEVVIGNVNDLITPEMIKALKKAKIISIKVLDEYVFSMPDEAINTYMTKSRPVPIHEIVWTKLPKWKIILKDSPKNIVWEEVEAGKEIPKWVKIKENDPEEVDIFEEVFYRIAVGRLIFNERVPAKVGLIDQMMDKGRIASLIVKCFKASNNATTCRMLDEIKSLGFKYATVSGLSISASDLLRSAKKDEIIRESSRKVKEHAERFSKHQMNREEKRQADIAVWEATTDMVTDDMQQNFKELDSKNIFNSVYLMAISGARGTFDQIKQLAGMRGLMSNPHGDVIDFPIKSNFRDGLTVSEYFISTFGARKGLVDTALRTADSGYLTRRLVDVAQEVIVSELDCGTTEGIEINPLYEKRKPNNLAIDEQIIPLAKRIVGRIASEDVIHPITGVVIVKSQEEILEAQAKEIDRAHVIIPIKDKRLPGKLTAEVICHPKTGDLILRPDRILTEALIKKMKKAGIDEIKIRPKVVVRSPIACKTKLGICCQCYSRDLAIGRPVNLGEAAGVIAAQSIGEPGTQLTMRTFHIGGIALSKRIVIKSKIDGVVNLSRVETAWKHGKNEEIRNDDEIGNRVYLKGNIHIDNKAQGVHEKYTPPAGATLKVKDGDEISTGDVIVEYNPSQIHVFNSGTASYVGLIMKDNVVVSDNAKVIIDNTNNDDDLVEYPIPQGAYMRVDDGDDITAGDLLAETTGTQKAAISGIEGSVEFFNVKIKNNRVISENGLIFVIPDDPNKRIAVSYPLQKGLKDTKETGESKKYGLKLVVKNGNEVRYNDELIVIISELDGVAEVDVKKNIIVIKSNRNKEYIVAKSGGVQIDRKENTLQWFAEKDGIVDILAPKASTNKTSDSKRVIVNQEVIHKVPVSCQLYKRDLKVAPGKTIHEGEKLTKPIHLKSTINGMTKIINELDPETGNYYRRVEIKDIQDIPLNSKDEIGELIVGRKLMEDIIDLHTGDVIAQKHNDEKPSIIHESLIDRILLRTGHTGHIDFADTRTIMVDASTNRSEIIGLIPVKANKIVKSIVPGKPIDAEMAEELILAKGTKKVLEVKSDTIFVIKDTEHDFTEADKLKKSLLIGQTIVQDIKFNSKKLLAKGTVIDEKVYRTITENLDKIPSIITQKVSEYRVPMGATLRYKKGDKVPAGSELVYPTQLNKIVILEGEEGFEIPAEGELKIASGETIKAGDDIIKPLEPIVSQISGLVNYDTKYDKKTGEDMVEKIIVYTGFEYTIPAGIDLKVKKQSAVKKGDPITEVIKYDGLDDTNKRDYRIIRKEDTEKKYKITGEMDLLVETGDNVTIGQKIASLKNFKYKVKEFVKPEDDEGTISFTTNYRPIIKDTLKIYDNGKEIILSGQCDLRSDDAIDKLLGMTVAEDIVDRAGNVIIQKKTIIDKKIAKKAIDSVKDLVENIIPVINSELRVYYTSGEIFFKTMPQGEWTVEYASEADGVVKLLKRKDKLGKERTTIGEIVVQNGEAHQVSDGAELKVEDNIVGITTKIPFQAKLNEKSMMQTVVDVSTGEIIVEKGEFTNKGICQKLQKHRDTLNCTSMRAVSKVAEGTILAKMGSTAKKTSDIIQGLPRVQEIFEIRKPKHEAQIYEDSGEVRISGSNIVFIRESGDKKQHKTQFGNQELIISHGETIEAGDPISEGNIAPKKLVRIAGISKAAQYLVDEVQQVYRSQGVTINDKHIEVILRQMMRKVKVKEPGDTKLLPQEEVHINDFYQANAEVMEKGLTPATGERILQGITQAALSTESFLSAASFQETTRVLTKAAIESKVDLLRGLKENLIIGKLIPAGTGLKQFGKINVTSPDDIERYREASEEQRKGFSGINEMEMKKFTEDYAEKLGSKKSSDLAKNFHSLFSDTVSDDEMYDETDNDDKVDGKE